MLKYLYLQNLNLKLEKFKFQKEQANFLVVIIRQNGIRIDSDKNPAIKNLKTLINIKEL